MAPSSPLISLRRSPTGCQSLSHYLSRCSLIGCCCWRSWSWSPSRSPTPSPTQNRIHRQNYWMGGGKIGWERERGCHTCSFVIWPKVFDEVISLKRNILHTEHLLQSVKARNAKEEAKITALTCGRWLKISHLWYKLKIEAYEENVEDDKTVVYDVNCRLRIAVFKYRCV